MAKDTPRESVLSKVDGLFCRFALSAACIVSLLAGYFIYLISSLFSDTQPDRIDFFTSFMALGLIGVSPGIVVSVVCPFYVAGLRRGGLRDPLYEGLAVFAVFPTAFPLFLYCLRYLS